MKRTYIVLMLCCALAACKKNNVDFTFSPSAPRAGEEVTFTNQSSSGEDWNWTFGDGTISTVKSPTHTYKQPGTYLVTLTVDNKSSWTASQQITVYDTIPSFGCEDSLFTIYTDYTFKALVYNPYNYDVSYRWYMPVSDAMMQPYAEITDTTMENSSLHLYFTRPTTQAGIGLRVIMNGDTTYIQRSFEVSDRATNSVYFRTDEYDYRQRIFGDKAESAQQLAETSSLLDAEQDTLQVYNDSTFRLETLSGTFAGIEGFHIANRKIYYRANGLWVANIDGAYKVQIDTAKCTAMTLDTKDNRIYWANAEGILYMPFVGSDNNKFVTTPKQLNTITGITKIAADPEMK